jgi:hypothetical protein
VSILSNYLYLSDIEVLPANLKTVMLSPFMHTASPAPSRSSHLALHRAGHLDSVKFLRGRVYGVDDLVEKEGWIAERLRG